MNNNSADSGDRFVNSFIVVLEQLMKMNPKITMKVKQQATQVGIEWIGKAKDNQNNSSLVLGCLLFLAVYDLTSVTTPPVLLNLLECFLLYDQAPKLFRLLRLENAASGIVETLKKKEEYYLATLKFICEFKLFKLCPSGGPGALLLDFLNSSEKAALAMETQRARVEKIQADAVMALDYIREKKLETVFSGKALKKLTALVMNEEPLDDKSDGKCQTATENSVSNSIIPHENKSKSKRQRLNEPVTSSQNPTALNHPLNGPGGDNVPSVVKTERSGVNETYPLSTETKSKSTSGFINAAMLRELVEKQPLEVSNALKCTSDPAKLVLETSMALSPTKSKGGYEFNLLITSASFFLLLDQLKKHPPQIGNPLKGDAKRLAIYWKDKIIKNKKDQMEVVCFLLFLGIFRIVSEFKTNDLLRLLDHAYWKTVSPDLCKFLGLESAIHGFIQSLIVTGHRIRAIDYIYSLDMVERFRPVSAIINDFLRIIKESSEKSFREAKNESTQQVAAIDRQIKSIRAAITCITSHKLESEFELGDLRERINSLLKSKRNLSGSKPDSTIKQPLTAKPTNLADVDSVTSNTHMEHSTAAASSSASKTYSVQKKGKKRSLSGNYESSVDVASNSSNHFSGHGDSLNQRQIWPVDPYGRGFTGTPNSDFDYNRMTQPVGPHLYQFYHHLNPFYRNHF